MGIDLENISKQYGNLSVVDGLTLKIADGEFVVLLGPSGCGKTTTLRMIAGLEQMTSGDILIAGRRVNDLPPQKRDVAMVFQSYALYPHMTVAGNIAYPLRVRKLPAGEIAAQVKQTAALLEIESLLARRPRELSGGERQRVALARAIVRHPKAFLMDEPLSNLDAKLRLQMRGELKRLQHELATTTVYVTHDQAEAMTLGHRVAVMNKGKLQQFDTPLEIYNRPANRFVAEFVGSPSMNLVAGEIDGASRTFRASDGALHLVNIPVVGANGPVTFGMRPENIEVSSTPRDGWSAATVYVTELMGSETFVIVEIGKQKIIARAASDFRAETGSNVWINFDFRKAHWFNSQTGLRL
ncbi:MAG TPA: sn-glycerol-3-phosphate ABC transporter ATP-binding protein UgpC [Pyrinomonadaceae bacterium]|nr:sn-glycerol-3-phosphate ABC transporter ATP-binding protein UgpC [Pyrinomonadaceae bacterium]